MLQLSDAPNRLEIATAQGIYDYWLTQEDIADIARLEYQDYGQNHGVDWFKTFEIVGSPSQLRNELLSFRRQTNRLSIHNARLTLIINLDQLHWVSLVFVYQNKFYNGYYIDSLGESLPQNYLDSLKDLSLLPLTNLSGYFRRQTDGYNCGLWALENAHDLTRMFDEQRGFHWLTQQLQRSRDARYFSEQRRLFSSKLRLDFARIARPRLFTQTVLDEGTDNRIAAPMPDILATADEPQQKKQKVLSEAEKVDEKLEFFVQRFMGAFAQRLGAYYLVAKGDNLTASALKNELKTGAIGALLGIAISQNIVGSVPSLVASLRTISSKYYSKKTAQKITKAFSEVMPGGLSEFLTEAAVEIFQSYEQQFFQVTDKAGARVAIEKLAEDASGRVLNYIDEKLTPTMTISSELIARGILLGKSEKYFDPSLKKVRVRVTGGRIQDAQGNSFSTASFYEKVGLVIKAKNTNLDRYYKIRDMQDSTRYGYRRPLSWEKDSAGQLKANVQSNYIQENPVNLILYAYKLNPNQLLEKTRQIIQKIRDANNRIPSVNSVLSSKNNLFNLRNPLKNFSGRRNALNTLHQLLSAETKSAVITQQMLQLSLSSTNYRPTQPMQEGNQAAIGGLGGIGKTQLALQYAKLYAANYDNNILWIDAEKRIDLINCFKKLAVNLAISQTDALGNQKENDQLIEDVYAFFSHSKSLFILDNVKNYQAIATILPKASIANKPTILITSRYSNWQNIALTLLLDVFTEVEAVSFIKNELSITHVSEDHKIKELNDLLQGLPLALQQAVAYIKNEKNIDTNFNIQSYIDSYKQKGQKLLNFNFFRYNNDPYSKTVFTTWGITLDKISKEKVIGKKAIEILQMMAYLYPDNINNEIFRILPDSELLSAAIQLLKSYSMINEGSGFHVSTIHRLVQKVLRINLENNPSDFKNIVQYLLILTDNFTSNKEILSHYLSFLLHMTQHVWLTKNLNLKSTHKKILQVLTFYEEEESLFFNVLDNARTTLPRKKYLDLIGEALVIYTRTPFISALINVIDYIEKGVSQGLLLLEEAKVILDFKYTITRREYKDIRFSSLPGIRVRQFQAIRLVFDLEHRLFSRQSTSSCRAQQRKRSISSLCSLAEDELIERPINHQQLRAYFKKIRLVANLANFALLTKDTLSALIQGDFESIAITFTLLSSSRILGKLSNKLLIKGEEQLLLDDVLLQEELDYDAKLAFSLFTDEKIMLAGKRRFLGNAMKAAAPFVARGTSAFFAYNFVQGLRDNQTDSVDNIANGAIVAVDLGEAGIEAAEYLGYIAGFSEVTGPIGEGLGLLAIGGIQLYHVNKELSALEKWVHLSEREKFVQGMRAFFNLQPSEYLDAKANNNQQLNKAIAFLKLHPEIKYYIFPAWLSATALHEESLVLLDAKRQLNLLIDTVPNESNEGLLFCLAGELADSNVDNTTWIEGKLVSYLDTLVGVEQRILYLCKNAIGLEYTGHRTGNLTLIALHEGTDMVIGADSDTVFMVNNGTKNYRAWHADDLFILQGSRITGELEGGQGINIVKFSDYEPQAGDRVLLDMQAFLCGTNKVNTTVEERCVDGLKLSNITQIHGRDRKQDTVFLSQGITYVDTYAGESAEKLDHIYITEKSSKNISMVLRPNTVVRFLGNTTDNAVTYKVPPGQMGIAYVQLPFNAQTRQQFYFEFSLENLNVLNLKNNSISWQFTYADGNFDLIIEDLNASISNINTTITEKVFTKSTSYIFAKNLEIKLTEKTLYAQLHTNSSMDEIIQRYAPIAHRVDKAMVIQVNQNETIAIGGRQQEILSTDGLLLNHLIGNAENSVYIIQPPKNLSNPFPLRDITLYKLETDTLASTTDTLDLRALLVKAKEQCSEQIISTVLSENNQDLILTLNADYHPANDRCVATTDNDQIAKIILKNALVNYSYQDLDIVMDQQPMTIIFDDDRWRLAPIPLVFAENKNIIVITAAEIKANDEFFILKDLGEYDFLRYNDTNLLLTNVFHNVTKLSLYTVLFSHFFQCPLLQEKILSLSINFLDQSLTLGEHAQDINNATDFYQLINSYYNETTSSFFNQSAIFINDGVTELSVQRTRRDIITAVPISSAASEVAPGIYILTYIPLKMTLLANLMLNNGLTKNVYFGFIFLTSKTLEYLSIKRRAIFNDLEQEFAVSKKTMLATVRPEETTGLVYCHQNNFFEKKDCVKNQASLGLLGYCANSQQIIIWFSKNTHESASSLTWFAIGYHGVPANTTYTRLRTQATRLSVQKGYLYFDPAHGCRQVINLNKISNNSMATVFPYLPEEAQQWLKDQWLYEKKLHDKVLQNEIAIGLFKQHTMQIGLLYIGNVGLLHSFAGDYLQAMGLKPNWQDRDPYHFLARWLTTVHQLRLGSNQTMALTAALLETALLHPKFQQGYFFVLPDIRIRHKKQVIRLFADLLQGGPLHFVLLPSLLEFLFSQYMPIEIITWGLRIIFSFYVLNNDPSYYYLGIALFFLPQLPLLLEHLGIPVTAYLSKTLEKLTQLFISHSLIVGLIATPDLSRLAERKLELQAAEQRVLRGSERLSNVVKPLVCFFKPIAKTCFNHQENQPQENYFMHKNTM